MDSREFKEAAYIEISTIVKSISNPHRLEIIDILSNGEKSVEQIALETNMSIANASQHLQTLKRSKWIKNRREKNFIYYELKNQYAYAIWKTIREFARLQIPEINSAMDNYRKGQQISTIKFADAETLRPYSIVDARPVREYNEGHIDNAISSSSKASLPRNTNLLIYSRGPFCTLADEEVLELNKSGFNAYRIEEGYRDLAR